MNEFWYPPLSLKGRRCFVLGGGPSLTRADVDRLRGEAVIAVNVAYRIAPFADILFFGDLAWFRKRIADLALWPNLLVTTARKAPDELPGRIKLIYAENRPEFPPPGCGVIRNGLSSGHRAIALAVAMGAAEIVLLGFDMRFTDDGRSHFHDEYAEARGESVYRDYFIPGFAGWAADAKRRGVTILNATAGSALDEFQRVTLDEVLTCARS